MIKFLDQPSMFEAGKIELSWTITGDKHSYGPILIGPNEVKTTKNNIVRKMVCAQFNSLLVQRQNAYRHSGGHKREETLKAVQHLEYNLPQLKEFKDMLLFFTYAVNEIIPHLETITPSDKSRYVNFHINLLNITGFCRRCEAHYYKLQQTAIKTCQTITA